jgi:hypothetical protein
MKIRRDGKAYDGADATITALGNVWEEVVSIEYNTTMEHQKNYTLGMNDASSWSMGKKDHTGSITMMMNQAVQIENACKGDLLRIKPFTINVTFVNEYNQIVNDTVQAKFQSQGREVNTEMGLNKQYELFVLGVEYNNA